jgi:hypothetical protein
MKPEPVHHDLLGTQIKVGDYVAVPNGTTMYIAIVTKLHKVMVGVTAPNKIYQSNYYPKNLVILGGPQLIMYLLKK